MGNFNDAYSNILQGIKDNNIQIDPNAYDEELLKYDDTGTVVGIKSSKSKVLQLDHHVVSIDMVGEKIKIRSLLDPTIAGHVMFETENDSDLAFEALESRDNLLLFLKHHSKDDTAFEWSKIVADEDFMQIQNDKKAAKSKADDASSNIALGDIGGGGGDAGEAPEEPEAEPEGEPEEPEA